MASDSFALTAPAVESRRWLSREIAVRFALCGVAVGVCYCFQWQWLKVLTCDANLWLDRVVGVYQQRISATEVVWRGHLYYYAIACTLADAWCGALTLIWDLRKSVGRNLLAIARFTPALFVFNILRLTTSDLLVAHGASWAIGHSLFCGCAYFLVWLWVCRQGTPLHSFWPFPER
jgi:hypothetical protein